MYYPIAIFNETQNAYTHYRRIHPRNVWELIEIISPAPSLAEITEIKYMDIKNIGIKTMLRKDTKQSFYVKPHLLYVSGIKSHSYSSELGIIDGRKLVSGDNPYGVSIGWSSDGEIIKCFIENGKITCNTLKDVGMGFPY